MFNKFFKRVKGLTQQIASQSYPKLVLIIFRAEICFGKMLNSLTHLSDILIDVL
jgi:hypothetical protein